jgi:hypothetical protein
MKISSCQTIVKTLRSQPQAAESHDKHHARTTTAEARDDQRPRRGHAVPVCVSHGYAADANDRRSRLTIGSGSTRPTAKAVGNEQCRAKPLAAVSRQTPPGARNLRRELTTDSRSSLQTTRAHDRRQQPATDIGRTRPTADARGRQAGPTTDGSSLRQKRTTSSRGA